MIEHIAEGFQFARQTRPVRDLLLLIGVVSLVGMPYTVLMPIFADQILHGGAWGLGGLLTATGVGAVWGAIPGVAHRSARAWLRRGAIRHWIWALLIVFAFSRNFIFSLIVLVPTGFTIMTQMACANTLIQSMVPDRLRGRMMSLYSMMLMGMAPLGALFGGVVANWISAPWAVAIGGIACLGAARIFYVRLHILRRKRSNSWSHRE